MPTYEYECTKCHHVCEEFKPMNAPRRQRCPVCRGKVERLISGGSGIVFKGDGFYVNDSRHPRDRKQADSASEPGTKPPSGGEAKPEAPAKPAATDTPSPSTSAATKKSGGEPAA